MPDEKDHWQELADLLGLPPEGAPVQPSSPAPETPAEPTARPWDSRTEFGEPAAEDQSARADGSSFDVSTAPPPPRRDPDADEGGDDRPRRDRRRGRGRHRESEDQPGREEPEFAGGVAPTLPDDEAAALDEETFAEEREPAATVESDQLDDELERDLDEPVEEAPAAAEDDDEPVEKLGEWNVPSWNDLIASLYRPDR